MVVPTLRDCESPPPYFLVVCHPFFVIRVRTLPYDQVTCRGKSAVIPFLFFKRFSVMLRGLCFDSRPGNPRSNISQTNFPADAQRPLPGSLIFCRPDRILAHARPFGRSQLLIVFSILNFLTILYMLVAFLPRMALPSIRSLLGRSII